MSGANTAKIGAGTTLYFQDPDSDDLEDLELENAIDIGDTGEEGSFVDASRLKDTTKRFAAGMTTPPQKGVTLHDVPGDINQDKFLAAAKAKKTLAMKVVFSNGRTGLFTLITAGYKVNKPDAEGLITVTVAGQQSGETEWSFA